MHDIICFFMFGQTSMLAITLYKTNSNSYQYHTPLKEKVDIFLLVFYHQAIKCITSLPVEH